MHILDDLKEVLIVQAMPFGSLKIVLCSTGNTFDLYCRGDWFDS